MLKRIKRLLAAMFARGPSPKTNLHRQPFDLCMKALSAPQAVRKNKQRHVNLFSAADGEEVLHRHLAARRRADDFPDDRDLFESGKYVSGADWATENDHSTSNHSSSGE